MTSVVGLSTACSVVVRTASREVPDGGRPGQPYRRSMTTGTSHCRSHREIVAGLVTLTARVAEIARNRIRP
jgi:hypothetical protein